MTLVRDPHDPLASLGVLDTPPEPLFDAMVEAAAALCGTDAAILTFVAPPRIWVKAAVGFDASTELPSAHAPCDEVVRSGGWLEVPDASADPRFAGYPLVQGADGVRLYAGAPVCLSDGSVVGSLAVVDRRPQSLTDAQQMGLQALATAVSRALEERREASRRAERSMERLDAQARRLSHTLDGMGAGTWEWNVQTGETRFNERWAEIIGYRLDELGPTTIDTWMAHAHPDDLEHSGALLEAHFRGDTEIYECEARMRHRDGRLVWVLDRGRVMTRTADGQPEWMYGTHLDLTERKAHEEALRRSEWLLDKTGRLAEIGGWVLELSEGAPRWTAQTRRIHGVDDDYVPTLDQALDFYPPEVRPTVEAAVALAMDGGPGWDLELPFVRADGHRIWVRAVGEVERENGVPVRLIGAFQDISRQRAQRLAVQEASDRLELANDAARIGVWEFDLANDRLVWDDQMYHLYGLTPGVPIDGSTWWDRLLHPEDRDEARARIVSALKAEGRFEMDFRTVWPDGSVHYIHAAAEVQRDEAGRAVRTLGVSWDVTEQKHLEQALFEQHSRMRVTLRSIGDAVITTDPLGRVEWLNPVACKLTGWTPEQAEGRPIHEVFHIVHEETRAIAPCPVADCLSTNTVSGLAKRTVLLAADGGEYGIEDSAAPIIAEDGELLGVVLVFHDVTEQRRISSEMTYRATHDPLTGLVNREEFELRLRRALDRAHVDGSTNAVMFVDLDQFKIVNDTCGHPVGDELLKQTASLLAEDIRVSDTLARLGGDEFGIILEHCTVEVAQRIAQAICDRMDAFRFVHDEHTFRIGTSIGLVPVDGAFDDAASVLQAADACCYAAKEAGRNRVHRWRLSDEAMAVRRGETMWAARVERAIDDDAFVLHAQRIRCIDGDRPDSAEVLIRMVGDDGRLIYPGAFLPSAERFGLGSRLDGWVLRETLKMLADRSSEIEGVGTLNVNLSGQSIGDRVFHAQALQMLDRAGRGVCERLCLEITETVAVTNMADAKVFVAEARKRGVRIALDDFGAGASSFGYLRQLPVDVIKIDGQYVQRLLHDELDDATVRCFVDIARVLGVTTVAEFVDDPAILERLGQLGVDYAQGFLVHRPEALCDALRCDQAERASA
jgi:diguanylate cyclase (GGDEF)-like protein/PAS domain S-box-containing protein